MGRRAPLLLLFCAWPNVAEAHELLRTQGGVELHWARAQLEFDAVFALDDPEGVLFARAFRRAFDGWATQSRGRLRPAWRGPTAAAVGDDGRSTAILADPFDADFGDPSRTVAHAELFYDVATGVIRDGDVYLNAARFRFSEGEPGTFDQQSVLLHELGHVLGLAHTCGEPGRRYPSCFSVPAPVQEEVLEAVMAPTLSAQTLRRQPTADDLAGLAVHHVGSSTITQPELQGLDPCGGLSAVGLDPDDQVAWRYASGRFQPVDWRPDPLTQAGPHLRRPPDPDQGDADLVLVDAQSGAYDVEVAWTAFEVCPTDPKPEPPPEEEGCGCTTEGSGGRQGPFVLATLLIVAVLVRRRIGLILSLSLLALWPQAAWAFKCSRVALDSGPSLVWPTRSIPWVADPNALMATGDRAIGEADLLASFQAWTDIDCSDIELPYQGEVPGVRAELNESGPNVNAVVWVSNNWPYDASAIAVTTTAYDRNSGVVVDADIELNGQYFVFGRSETNNCQQADGFMDLRNTMTHEVGHVLGLDHPPNTPRYAEATMYASAPPCETKKRSLAADDRDGICTIYPAGAATAQCFPPNGPSFLQTDSDDGYGCRSVGLGSPAWWLLGAAWAFRRRRAA